MKRCGKCNIKKKHSAFCVDNRAKDGLASWCRECHLLHQQSKKGKESKKVAAKKYSQTKKGKTSAYRANKNWNKRHPSKVKEYRIKCSHGLSLAQYTTLLDNQEGLCAICRVQLSSLPPKQIHVDHCHRTKKVRGVLCHYCNLGLGQFRDSILYLDAAKRYLTGAK